MPVHKLNIILLEIILSIPKKCLKNALENFLKFNKISNISNIL